VPCLFANLLSMMVAVTRTPYLDFCQILKQLPSWLVSEVIFSIFKEV
jgi:hypothetical protein